VNNSTPSKRSPFLFFVLVYALSIPLWVINAIFPMNLPVDNLPATNVVATFCPAIAASVLMYREENFLGVKNLWARFDALPGNRTKLTSQ